MLEIQRTRWEDLTYIQSDQKEKRKSKWTESVLEEIMSEFTNIDEIQQDAYSRSTKTK